MQWFQTPYPGYKVTASGKVRGPEGVMRPSTNGTGYDQVTIHTEQGPVRKAVHVLVCETFHGPRPTPSSRATRKGQDRSDNSADNLFWHTSDRVGRGRGGIVTSYLSADQFDLLEAMVEETGRSRSSLVKEGIQLLLRSVVSSK